MATPDVTRIAGNIAALNALNSLNSINNELAVHQTRLATGKRLNEAADDPAAFKLAITFDVRRQGLQTVLSAIGDAKNLLSTAEGGLKKVQDILVKMKNKALEAKGGTIGTSERQAIQDQLKAYADEIDDIATQTQWNGENLITGSAGAGAASGTRNFLTSVNAGSYTTAFSFSGNQGFSAQGTTAAHTGLGLKSDASTYVFDVTGGSAAVDTALSLIETAVSTVKTGIAEVGAFTARLSFKEEALSVQNVNTEAAYNRIMNANMASEQVEASKFLILQQTATAMLAQANTSPQFLLQLFR
jgi:flagellin